MGELLPTATAPVPLNGPARLARWQDALFELLADFAGGRAPASTLAIVNEEALRAGTARRLSPQLNIERVNSTDLVGELVTKCLDELAACDPIRLKQCSRPECCLLFYDTTRNRSARWHAENPCGWRSRDERRRRPPPSRGGESA
jgi:predicted RNA-binding Zn ribbon-like protein